MLPKKNHAEFILYYIYPMIRKELTLELIKEGYSQKEIARLMNITPSTISQYLHKKRSNFRISSETENIFRKIVLDELEKLSNEKKAKSTKQDKKIQNRESKSTKETEITRKSNNRDRNELKHIKFTQADFFNLINQIVKKLEEIKLACLIHLEIENKESFDCLKEVKSKLIKQRESIKKKQQD